MGSAGERGYVGSTGRRGCVGSAGERGCLGAALVFALAAGCNADDAPGGYLDDARVRRAALEASLIEPTNTYSRRRLEHYASGGEGDWDALPVWNPRAVPVAALELEQIGGAPARTTLAPDARALDVELDEEITPEGLRAIGEAAFWRYPAQRAPSAAVALRSPESAASYGLWVDDQRGVGGLVRAEMPDGATALALSCASCHAAPRPGLGLVMGVGNERLDLGRLVFDNLDTSALDGPGSFGAGGRSADLDDLGSLGAGGRSADLDDLGSLSARGRSAEAAGLLRWGPGRVDVSTAQGVEPVRIPDLRPTRWLTHLHHAGAVAQTDRIALAVRIETLLITSYGATLRPPRAVALGLAYFLWSLSSPSPPSPPTGDVETRGEALFGERCARCHAPPGFAGPPVAIDEVGTEPSIARSTERGTGRYRVPSLRGVGSRGPLLHDASAPSLAVLFDPARVETGFEGSTRGGAIAGHAFGLELDDTERAALIAYLNTL